MQALLTHLQRILVPVWVQKISSRPGRKNDFSQQNSNSTLFMPVKRKLEGFVSLLLTQQQSLLAKTTPKNMANLKRIQAAAEA